LFHTYSRKGNILNPGQTTLNIKFHVKYVKERNTGGAGRINRNEGKNNCTCDCGVFDEVFWGSLLVFQLAHKIILHPRKDTINFPHFFLTKFGAAERLVISNHL